MADDKTTHPVDVGSAPYKRRRFPWSIKVRFLVAWYDLWIGAYVDLKGRRIYILPLPCIGLCIWWDRLPLYYISEPGE